MDIENRQYDKLKKYHSSWFQHRYSETNFKAKEMYYQQASDLVNDGPFDSERDKNIWELHAEGLTYKEISDKININTRTVYLTVKKYKEAMGKLNELKSRKFTVVGDN